MSDLLSTSEAAKLIGITRHHVSELLREGKLTGQMVGNRWVTTKKHVRDYLKKKKITGDKNGSTNDRHSKNDSG